MTNKSNPDSEPKSLESERDSKSSSAFRIPRRYYLTFCAFIGFAVQYAMRVNLSIAILYMTKNETITEDGKVLPAGEYADWDTVTVGSILGAFFYGYILTMFPGGWLSCKFGGRRMLGYGIGLCGVLTLLTTAIARLGAVWLIALRVLEGATQGVCFPAIQGVWSKWAPEVERAKLSGIVYSGFYFGIVIAMPLSSVIAEYSHWETVFYVSGIFGVLWAILWLLTVYDTPQQDKFITKAELNFILQGKPKDSKCRKNPKVPWMALMTSLPVWAITAIHFSSNWVFYTMLTKLPAYMNDVLHFQLQSTGFVSALPYLTMAITLQLSGMLSHRIQEKLNLRLVTLRKWMVSGAALLQSIFIFLTVSGTSTIFCIFSVCCGLGFGGIVWSGFSTNQLDIGDQYASVVMGITNTFATVPGMISPILVGAIVKTRSFAEWRTIFFICGLIHAAGAVVYVFFGKAEKQKWAEITSSDSGEEAVQLTKS